MRAWVLDGRANALTPTLLDGAIYKVARAEEQIRELRAEMTASPTNPNYRGFASFDDNRREYTVDAVMSRMALIRWGVVTGEIVHNLRSALDLSICALARLTDPEDDCADLYFPVASKPPAPEKHLSDLRMVRIPEAVAVIGAHQPYASPRPEDHPLRVLHDLNRWDKHRVLQVVFLEFVIPTGAEVLQFQETPSEDGATAYHMVVRFPPGMRLDPGPTPVIVFSKPGPAYGDPVLRRLGLIHAEVKAVVNEITPLFEPRS